MRALAAALLAPWIALGCDGPRREPVTPPPSAATFGPVELVTVFDFPRSDDTQSLSGIVWDERGRRLVAIQDEQPRLVPLVPSADLRTWTAGPALPLVGRPAGEPWDGEGLAPDGDGWIVVAYERGPLVERYDAGGNYRGKLSVPGCYAHLTLPNLGLEGLAISPSGRSLFLANEAALTTDGPLATKARGTVVRITRRDQATGADVEYAYRTEALGGGGEGDMGVSDVAAPSDDVLLVLERGFQKGYGNTVRIYRVDLRGQRGVPPAGELGADAPILPKRLLVDVGSLSCASCTHPAAQPNPILENYEGLALGPEAPGDRRYLFVVSDDNERMEQVPRLLVLTVPNAALR